MTQLIKLAKVTTIPVTLEKNTMYLLKNSSNKLAISLTDSTGDNAIELSSSYNDLTDKPAFATVAISGDYADLVNKPSIILTTDKGVANGVADLDANVKIPLARLPDSILGQLEYQGPYDMATALPAASTANKGWYYIASNATIANGYVMGDWAVSNGTSWDKIDNTDAVQSVAGKTGAVTLTTSDLTNFATATAGFATLTIPVSTKSTAYTLVLADKSTRINTTAGITVPTGIFAAGDAVIIYNNSSAAITITTSAVTAYIDGVDSVKTSITLVARGLAAINFNSASSVVVSGKGVS